MTRAELLEAKRKAVAAHLAAPGDATWRAAAEATKAAHAGQWPTAPAPNLELEIGEVAGDHHCKICGKYAGRSNDNGKTWRRRDHDRGRP